MLYRKFIAIVIFLVAGFAVLTQKAEAAVDFNCYCLNGSVIPLYYPKLKTLNTANFDSCHQECANVGAKYFSFSTVSHMGTTRVTLQPSTGSSGGQGPTEAIAPGPTGSSNYRVPGTTEGKSVISCGRSGQRMCTLCDIIVGINNIIRYGFQIAIVIALTAISIGGVMYTISAGDSGQITQAKGIIKSAAVGMIIVFAAWLIVNYTMILIGAKTNLGITRVQSWYKFECRAPQNR